MLVQYMLWPYVPLSDNFQRHPDWSMMFNTYLWLHSTSRNIASCFYSQQQTLVERKCYLFYLQNAQTSTLLSTQPTHSKWKVFVRICSQWFFKHVFNFGSQGMSESKSICSTKSAVGGLLWGKLLNVDISPYCCSNTVAEKLCGQRHSHF